MAQSQRKETTFDQIQEILREVSESQKDTDRKFQGAADIVKEQANNLKSLDKLFTGQWGKLVESLVGGVSKSPQKERCSGKIYDNTNKEPARGESLLKEYKDKKAYGAMAYLRAGQSSRGICRKTRILCY